MKGAFGRISSKQFPHNLFTKIARGEKFFFLQNLNDSHTEEIIYFWTCLKLQASPQKKNEFVSKRFPVKINRMVTWWSFFSLLAFRSFL